MGASGSGAHNDPEGQKALFEQEWQATFGEPPTAKDWEFVYGSAGSKNYNERGREVMGAIQGLISQAQTYATDYGLTLTPQQAFEVAKKANGGGFSNGISETAVDHIVTQLGNASLKSQSDPTKDPFTGEKIVSDKTVGYQTNAAATFKSIIGRDPTQDELDYFSDQIAGGMSNYEMGNLLKQSPEYLEQQNTIQQQKYTTEAEAARNALQTQMLATEEEAFKRSTPQIIAEYMRSGRINSSGLDSAIANARADLSKNRESYMSGLQYEDAVRGLGYNREDYLGTQGKAYDQYLRDSAPDYQAKSALTNYQAMYPYQQAERTLSRAQQIEDYYRQQSDYNNYLRQQMKAQDKAGLYGIAGNIASAATTALMKRG
jgi:hypothetical protein